MSSESACGRGPGDGAASFPASQRGWTVMVPAEGFASPIVPSDAMTASRLSPKSETGFSLVEVLVSMMVLGMIAVSVFFFLSTQNSMGTRSGDMLKGLNLGKLAMDSLKVSDYDALEAGSDTVVDRYIRSWRITVGTGADGRPDGRKVIDLSVHWPLTAENHLAFTSILSDGRFKEER